MSTIMDIHLPFRDAMAGVPSSYKNAYFFTEANSKNNGRRIITHEFPKKDIPYSEDMGRRAKVFTIRAYCITYPYTMDGAAGGLYNIDYRVARDNLLSVLEEGGPGKLVLQTLPPENVVVTRYRLTEEDAKGGYCTFDIEFAEFGLDPQVLTMSVNTAAVLNTAADTLRDQTARGLAGDATAPPSIAGDTFNDRFPQQQRLMMVHR
jgi:prophage DNA circulation protein